MTTTAWTLLASVAGTQGAAGNSLLNGTSSPTASQGNNGDFFLNTATSTIYGPKASGAWPSSGISIIGAQGSQGLQGTAGSNGNTVLNGTTSPTSAIGNVGDFYVNTTANTIFGPKASNGWATTGVSIVGPQGTQGTQGVTGYSVQSGAGAPSSTTGSNGDIYVDLTGFNLYGKKASGQWPTSYTNFQGGVGATGSAGATGATGSAGNGVQNGSGAPTASIGQNGDFYLNTANTTLYGPKASGAWPTTYIALVGTAGTNGTNGTNGANGNTVLNGTSAPTASQGNNGDFFINTATNVIYGPKASGAWPSTGTSIVGPQGPSTAATVPNDITGNSLSLAPVSGDSTAVGLTVSSSSGAVFSISAAGAVVGASTGVFTGALTSSVVTPGNGALANPSFAFKNQVDTGVYLATQSTSAAVLGFATNGAQQFTIASAAINCRSILISPTVTTTQVLVQGGYASSSGMVYANVGGTGENVTFNLGGTSSVLYASSSGVTASPQMYSAKVLSPLLVTNAAGTASAPSIQYSGTSAGLYFSANPNPAINFAANSSGPQMSVAYNAITLSQPTTLSSAATLTANAAITTAATVTSTTAAGTPSFVSTQGFKQTYDMGWIWGNGAMPTTASPMLDAIVTQGATSYNYMVKTFVPAYAGSVLALAGWQNGPLSSGQTVVLQVYINGSAVSGFTITLSSTSGSAATSITKAKNATTFAANSTIQVYATGSAAAINPAFSCSITVEMAA